MIYEIDNKYYVKIGYEYNEIEIKLDDNGEVVLIPKKNRIDASGKTIKAINFKSEQENFKNRLSKAKVEKPKQIIQPKEIDVARQPKAIKNNKKWNNW